MMDMLPFPRRRSSSQEEQIADIYNYLIQLKETLEFALTNISADNLSLDLINTLNKLGANINESAEEREYEVMQISSKALTINDVCNSEEFKLAVEEECKKYI